jgi:hypothetical protein
VRATSPARDTPCERGASLIASKGIFNIRIADISGEVLNPTNHDVAHQLCCQYGPFPSGIAPKNEQLARKGFYSGTKRPRQCSAGKFVSVRLGCEQRGAGSAYRALAACQLSAMDGIERGTDRFARMRLGSISQDHPEILIPTPIRILR